MTGAEHFAEAERLIESVSSPSSSHSGRDASMDPVDANQIALAQVHATLALAAATNAQTETFFK